ncbi:uncharacterized protein K460DRAFT_419139 [Cucurbitaria berberidis CBS 394.84]|uniref:Zinc finger PHD-type domain-containing protein n=1 Tax=Cucurbitaria berberidis CBS 394.84 TaxID=1168544 RepID=A0A9P4GFB7_9PLEO|nr:uncharacterized protein K460DRAFT_419139 [Cucurbitaria berberidis CBS 394.84]KAF1844194.1 hypothetical protein K460DRAFT_419139 [Cucurbitaria berberidis CBS 394.84]
MLDQQESSACYNEYSPCDHAWTASYHSADKVYEDESDYELAFDLQGRKHVEQRDNADGIYTITDSNSITLSMYTMPGKESANALRSSLYNHLPLHLITDEYGEVTPLNDILSNHLPKLQAKLWRELPQLLAARLSTPGPSQARSPFVISPMAQVLPSISNTVLSEDEQLLARHVKTIADLLDSNHIFVLRDGSKMRCYNLTCCTQDDNHTFHTHIITIEPLLDWGTVTPVPNLLISQGKVLVFSRDGEKMADPLWTLEVKALARKEPLAYCIRCLEHLMRMRVKAWAIIDQLGHVAYGAIHPYDRPTRSIHYGNKQTEVDWLSKEPYFASDSVNSASGSSELSNSHNQAGDQVTVTPLQLDGPIDSLRPEQRLLAPSHSMETPRLRSKLNLSSTVDRLDQKWSSHMEEAAEALESKDSPHGARPFTQAPGLTSSENVASPLATRTSTWNPVNQPLPTPATPASNQTFYYSDTPRHLRSDSGDHQPSSPAFRNTTSPVTSGHKTTRRFGCEIDTNAVVTYLRATTELTEDMIKDKKSKSDIRSFFAPVRCPSAQIPGTDFDAVKTRLNPILISDSSDSIDESEDSSNAKNPHELKGETRQLKPPKRKKISPKKKKKSPTRPKTGAAIKPLPKNKTERPQPIFSPLFAKRLPTKLEDIPDTVSEDTFKAYQTRLPEPNDLICSCQKPARTLEVKIAQCAGNECIVGWYHYMCLEKREKLKANFGTMVCQHCIVDKQFADQDQKNGWSVDKMVQAETQVSFTSKELLGAFPEIGGVMGVKNPYGLAVATAEDEAGLLDSAASMSAPENHGVLGSLACFGYADSRPHVVTEAYTNAQAYVYDAEDYDVYYDEEETFYEDENMYYDEETMEDKDEDDDMLIDEETESG